MARNRTPQQFSRNRKTAKKGPKNRETANNRAKKAKNRKPQTYNSPT